MELVSLHIVGLESKVRISKIDNFDFFKFSENIPEGAPWEKILVAMATLLRVCGRFL